MKRILVTGAGGFIGSHMAEYLVKQGHWVRAVDIEFDNYLKRKYYDEKVVLDLRELKNCITALMGVDEVYQFAADMGGIGYITSNHATLARNNILINANMLEACTILGVRKIFYSSSACVYPNFKQTKADVISLKEEDAMPADPNEIYGWEKLFSEQLYKAYEQDRHMEVRIARFHNVFGEEGTYKDGKEKAPAALCRKIANAVLTGSLKIDVWGDGKQTRSFMHVKDVCEGIYTLMESKHSEPLNLGSDRLIAIDDLAKLIFDIAKVKCKIKHDLTKPVGVRGRNSDNTKCRRVLGWEPKVSLEEGLITTYEWIKGKIKEDLKRTKSGSLADAHMRDHIGGSKL